MKKWLARCFYFGLGALARLAGLMYQFARAAPVDNQSRFTELAQRSPENLVSTTAQLIVCILLFFGSRNLASFWLRVRGKNGQTDSRESGTV